MLSINKKQSIKLFLIFFITLFSILIYIDKNYVLNNKDIKQITASNINQYKKITGKIKTQTIIKNLSIFKIYDNTSSINAIMFNLNKSLNKNQKYIFVGKITMYKNEPELIIYEINEIY